MFLLLLINFAYCLQFGYELERGEQVCFRENFSFDDAVDIRVRANSSNYSFKIAEAPMKKYEILYEKTGSWEHFYQHQSSHKVSQIRYCLTNLENDVIGYNITYKTGPELADLQKVAKIQDLNEVTGSMQKLTKLLEDIKRERTFLISKYDMMSKIQGSISKKQIAFGMLCLGVSMIVTVITVNMIKKIIKQKKSM